MITEPELFIEKTGSQAVFSRLISFLQSVVSCSLRTVSRWISFSHCNTAEIRVSLKVNSILKLFVAFFFFLCHSNTQNKGASLRYNEIHVHHIYTCMYQFSSVAQSRRTLCDPMNCNTAGLPVHHQFPEFTQTHVHQVSDAIQPSLCNPLLLLPSIPPSIRVSSNESTLRMRWPEYWSFSFSISPSNEHPGLIFRMDWLDLLAVQGTLKSLLQHHSSKASILRPSAFFYSPTLTSIHDHWKNHRLD